MNENAIMIDGYRVKEIRCKNDSCRALLGYENIRVGILIFTCGRCDTISIFSISYGEAKKEFMNKLQKKFEKGGE